MCGIHPTTTTMMIMRWQWRWRQRRWWWWRWRWWLYDKPRVCPNYHFLRTRRRRCVEPQCSGRSLIRWAAFVEIMMRRIRWRRKNINPCVLNFCELIFSGELHVPHRHLLERDQATGKVRKYQHTSKNLKIKLLLPRCTVHSNDEHCVKWISGARKQWRWRNTRWNWRRAGFAWNSLWWEFFDDGDDDYLDYHDGYGISLV